jgi:hypothetical protein
MTTQLENYVYEHFSTESSKSISEKFGVTVQRVSHTIRQLNKDGLIDTKDSFSQQLTKKNIYKEMSKNVPVSVPISKKVYEQLTEEEILNRRKYQRDRYLIRKGDRTKKIIPEITFKNHNGEGKNSIREFVSDCISKSVGRNPKILTLPCDQWIWEKLLLSKRPDCKFVGVEYDSNVFIQMVKTYTKSRELKKSVLSLHNSDMSEVINHSQTDEYSHMILDYCGIINSFKSEINDVLVRDLVKVNGYISITLSLTDRRNQDSDREISNILNSIPLNMFGDLDMTPNEICTRLSILNMVMNTNGRYKIDEVIPYNDSSKMIIFLIRRMK